MTVKTSDPYATVFRGGRQDWPHVAPAAKLVAVLKGGRDDRGLKLIMPGTRCIRKNEIHEFLVTDEAEAAPGAEVNRVAYVAFAEFTAGGVLVEGDQVAVGGRVIGEIAGFDETHMPNHQNIVVRSRQRISGVDGGLKLGDTMSFVAVYTKG